MDYRNLGRTGLKVSPLCLGAMMFGDQTDEATAQGIVARAREAGVNFVDTADVYAGGRSEEIVGRAIKGDRDRWVVATKAGFPAGKADLSRRYLLRAVEHSLRRLDIDCIDLFYLHRDDPSVPLEETVRTLGELIRQGKIRYFGISNFRGWRIAEIVRVCDALSVERPAACQPHYNAMNRMPEMEVLPACGHYGIGVVPYSPLARGVLTAKYASLDQLPEGSRAARKDTRMQQTELRAESLQLAQRIQAHAQAHGSNAAHFAMQWVLNNAFVTSVIAGPRTPAQWEDYLASLQAKFTAEDEALVDELVTPGHPSTPGFIDPHYPVTGRPRRT